MLASLLYKLVKALEYETLHEDAEEQGPLVVHVAQSIHKDTAPMTSAGPVNPARSIHETKTLLNRGTMSSSRGHAKSGKSAADTEQDQLPECWAD